MGDGTGQVALLALVVVGLIGLVLLVWLLMILVTAGVVGALHLLAFASEQGFVGLAAYIACWVLFFPVMLVLSLVIGGIRMVLADDYL